MTPPSKYGLGTVLNNAEGAFSLRFIERAGDDELDCWLSLPKSVSRHAPPFVSIHGIRRGAREHAALLGRRAASEGRVVVAPIYDGERWPRYHRFVRRQRLDFALLSLMTRLREMGVLSDNVFDLFGFDRGAQHAHRFAMLHPDRIGRLSLVASTAWSFTDEALFPYGVGAHGLNDNDASAPGETFALGGMERRLNAFLRLPMVIAIGGRESLDGHGNPRRLAARAYHGRSRLARAFSWVRGVEDAAQSRGIHSDIQFHILKPGLRRFRDCVTRGGVDALIMPKSGDASAVSIVRHYRGLFLQSAHSNRR